MSSPVRNVVGALGLTGRLSVVVPSLFLVSEYCVRALGKRAYVIRVKVVWPRLLEQHQGQIVDEAFGQGIGLVVGRIRVDQCQQGQVVGGRTRFHAQG